MWPQAAYIEKPTIRKRGLTIPFVYKEDHLTQNNWLVEEIPTRKGHQLFFSKCFKEIQEKLMR